MPAEVVISPPMDDAPVTLPDSCGAGDAGVSVLPAGVTRRIRVNLTWLERGGQLPYRVQFAPGGPWVLCASVEILGSSRMACSEEWDPACGRYDRTAHLETEAALRVRC